MMILKRLILMETVLHIQIILLFIWWALMFPTSSLAKYLTKYFGHYPKALVITVGIQLVLMFITLLISVIMSL